MKSTKRSLAMALALSFGALGIACSADSSNNNNGGTGGSSASGGSGGSAGRGGTGGNASSGGSTGGASSTGGSGGSAGGSGGTTGGSGGSTGGSGGSGGSTGGSGGSAGGTGGSTGGSGGSTGGSGGSGTDGGKSDGGKSDGSGGGDMGSAAGPLKLTVEGFTMDGDRNCYADGANNKGNISPKMQWGPAPAGTASWVMLTEDLTDPSTHMIICNIPPAVVGLPRDIKMMVPMNAAFGIKHANKRSVGWYGPGAGGSPRRYRISIWALATAQLAGGCGNAQADSARTQLYAQKDNKQVVLGNDSVEFWGNAAGACR